MNRPADSPPSRSNVVSDIQREFAWPSRRSEHSVDELFRPQPPIAGSRERVASSQGDLHPPNTDPAAPPSADPTGVQPDPIAPIVAMHIPWAIRIGIAALFVVNGVAAAVAPESFSSIVAENVLLGQLNDSLQMLLVRSAIVHDLGIAALLLSRRNDRLLGWWMAIWMASIAAVKALNMVFV